MGSGGSVTIGYKYRMGMHMVIAHKIDALLEIRAGDRLAWSGSVSASQQIYINNPDLFGGEKKEGGIQGYVDVMMGESTQAKNSYLVAKLGSIIPAFRGVFSVVLRNVYLCAMSPYPKAWSFKVRRIPGTDWYPAKANINGSANPAHIVYECLTNPDWGMGYSTASLDLVSFTAAADKLYTEGMGLSFVMSSADSIENFIYSVMSHINGMFYARPDNGQFALKLLRDDYTTGSLPLYNESNILKLENFERPSFAEMVNEIVVVYRPQGSTEDDSVTVQDLAAVQAQEGIVSQTVNYPGIDTASNASRVAMRDLRQKSTPLARVRLRVNRIAWNRTIGDVFKFSWAEHSISNMIVRILAVNYGDMSTNEIIIDGIEDVFGLPNATYLGSQPSGWTEPVQAPVAAAYRKLYEATYWDINRRYNDADLATLTSTSCFLEAAIGVPASATMNYEFWTHPSSGSYVEADEASFCIHGPLSADITYTQTAIVLSSITGDLDAFTLGDYGIIDTEIVRIDTIDTSTGAVTIGRGCLDTIAATHTAGARLYFAGSNAAYDPTEYVTGETLYAKILPRTGVNVLPIGSAPEDTLSLVGRFNKPYPPGKFQINSGYYPTAILSSLIASWAHRDRTQQLATIIDHTTGNIGPEVGVTYDLTVYNEDSVIFNTQTGLAGTSYTQDLGNEIASLAKAFTTPRNEIQIGASGDPYFGAVTLLTKFNGANGVVWARDETGKALTFVGDAQISTTQAKWGTASAKFDGLGDAITTPTDASLSFGTADFTIEMWVYLTAYSTAPSLFSQRNSGGGISFRISSSGYLNYFYGAGVNPFTASTNPVPLNAWSHVAIARSNGVMKMFVDGVQVGSFSAPENLTTGAFNPTYIGCTTTFNTECVTGFLDSVRVTLGVARYTAGFLALTNDFAVIGDTNWSNVVLMVPGSGPTTVSITELTGKTITTGGSATVSSAQVKYYVTSLLFNGTSSFMRANDSVDWQFTGDFTVEAWIRPGAVASNAIASQWYAGTATNCSWIFGFSAAGKLNFSYGIGATNANVVGATTISTGVWTHVAAVRSGTTVTLYVNGTSDGSGTVSGTLNDCPAGLGIGVTSVDVTPTNWYNGYISELRITKGFARYTSNFTAPVAALPTSGTDPNWANVMLLMTGQGVDNSLVIYDATGKTVTPNGNTALSVTQSKFNKTAVSFDGASDWLSIPYTTDFNFVASGDYTVELWVYPTSFAQDRPLFSITESNVSNFAGFNLILTVTSGAPAVGVRPSTGGAVTNIVGSSNATLNTWNHIAFSRSSGVGRLFLNGTQIGTATIPDVTGSIAFVASGIYANGFNASTNCFAGYLNDLRVTKGVARYIDNFLAPTIPWPWEVDPGDYALSQIVLSTHCDGTTGSTSFTDLKGKTITANGNAQVSTVKKRFGTASALFDGSGDYLSVPYSSDFDFGSGPWTIECWVNFSTAATNAGLVSVWASTTGARAWALYLSSGNLTMRFSDTGGTLRDSAAAWAPAANTWYHVAATKDSAGNVRVFVNGILLVSTSLPFGVNAGSNPLYVGAVQDFLGTFDTNGYIDDIRVTKGFARYVAAFRPPVFANQDIVAGFAVLGNYTTPRANNKLRLTLQSSRSSVKSLQKQDIMVDRAGYGYNYGKYYGGI